jgi:uncharacterized membrane protein YccC
VAQTDGLLNARIAAADPAEQPAQRRSQIDDEMSARASRALLWLVLREAQGLNWDDVADVLLELLQRVDQRLRALEYRAWEARLHAEGPNQPEAET